MNTHIIAIDTYGSQRIKHPLTGKTISAYKLGYTSAASAVLLALYGSRARDVSPRQASYYYIQIDVSPSVRHGFLLLKVTQEELARAEAVTRRYYRAATYIWREGKWWELPSSENPVYSEARLRSGCPSFDPSGFRVVSPSTGEKESAVEGIWVEKSQRDPDQKAWFWITGETFPHRGLLKRCGARFSPKRKAWYWIGWELPQAIQQLVDEHKPPEPLDLPDAEQETMLTIEDVQRLDEPVPESIEPEIIPSEAPEPQPIRIIPPPTFPSDDAALDTIQTAIQQVKAEPLPAMKPFSSNSKKTLVSIPQAYVGEVTGSISGNVFCYGYAVHEGVCVFLNLGGPRLAVEAIRAKLSKGEAVNLIPWDGPAIELTAGEGNSGMYHAYLQAIPEAKFASLILVHEWAVNPNYEGKSTTFLFHISEAQAMAQLKHRVTELVNVPVFDAWTPYLWQAGQSAMLVRPTRTGGDVKLWTVDLDADAWTRLITGGLANDTIVLYQ